MTRRVMPNTFSFEVCFFGIFGCFKHAQTFNYAVCAYTRLKTVFSFRYAKTPRPISSVRRNLVLNVFRRRNIAQIFQPVIVRISVNMVDIIYWPLTVRVKPNKSMRSVTRAVDPNNTIPKIVYGPCNVTNCYSSVGFYPPTQNACRRIVVKQFLKTFVSKHVQTPMVLSCANLMRLSMVKAP